MGVCILVHARVLIGIYTHFRKDVMPVYTPVYQPASSRGLYYVCVVTPKNGSIVHVGVRRDAGGEGWLEGQYAEFVRRGR